MGINILQNASNTAFIAAILANAFMIYSFFEKHKDIGISFSEHFKQYVAISFSYVKYIGVSTIRCVAILFLFLIGFGFFNYLIPSNQIGSVFEMERYSAQYIATVAKTATTFYKLPADIQREYSYSNDEYILRRVYWPNGGYLSFDDDTLVRPDIEYELEAQDGRIYNVTLTKERVSNPYQAEITPFRIVCISIYCVTFLFSCFYWLNVLLATFSRRKTNELYNILMEDKK